MNMLLWTDLVTADHFPIFTALKEAGFDGVEFPIHRGETRHYKQARAELDRVGLQATGITSLLADTNAISPDPAVRHAASEHMKWALEMCSVLESDRLSGPFHSAFKEFSGKAPTEDEKKWSAEVMRGAAELAGSAGIQLATEFLNRFECYLVTTAADARALVEAVDHPSFGMLFDTHHAHIEERDSAASIRASSACIKHVHISENDRGVPGKGQVHFPEIFTALHEIGYDGWLTIEAFSRISPEFAAAIHIWRDFFDSIDDIYREGGPFIRRLWQETA